MTIKEKLRVAFVIIVVAGIICGCGTIFGAYGIYGDAFFAPQIFREYKQMIYNNMSVETQENQIVFFGDSLTEMYDTQAYFPKYVSYNRGISGDITSHMLERLQGNVLDVRPHVLVFVGGTNDLNRDDITVEETADHIDQILKQTRAALPNCRIIVQNIYPVNNTHKMYGIVNTADNRKNEKIERLNDLIEPIILKNGCDLVDMHSLFVNEKGELDPKYSLDGLHINETAYELLTEQLTPLIDKYMTDDDIPSKVGARPRALQETAFCRA
ncbi:MAG: GDSL-type esterase/lipase family protein [Clostridia bacterium]